VGQTTLLISVLDSFINETAPFPKTVVAKIIVATIKRPTTARTLYRKATSV
jgi:hypothetical protein